MLDQIEWACIQHHDTWELIRIYAGLAVIPLSMIGLFWAFRFKKNEKLREDPISWERDNHK